MNKKKIKILVVDVGGTHIKALATGRKQHIKFASGPTMTPQKMIAGVRKATAGWKYDVVSIGCPGPVNRGKLVAEPHNLGGGWKNFNFQKAFGHPVKLINDAAMQALGSYRGGKMLFLGLGTGLGSALVVDGTIIPLELAHLPYKNNRTYEDYLGVAGLKRFGKKKWRESSGDHRRRTQNGVAGRIRRPRRWQHPFAQKNFRRIRAWATTPMRSLAVFDFGKTRKPMAIEDMDFHLKRLKLFDILKKKQHPVALRFIFLFQNH
ncbi:MAG: ROK family protein [Limisphaerales bacterium]